jgi:hypothetical protein
MASHTKINANLISKQSEWKTAQELEHKVQQQQ